jgi:hypothetical protein
MGIEIDIMCRCGHVGCRMCWQSWGWVRGLDGLIGSLLNDGFDQGDFRLLVTVCWAFL